MQEQQMQIVVENLGKKYICAAGSSLLETLRAQGVQLFAPCGGGGRCGKCRVQVVSGELPITSIDRQFLSAQELSRGVRLACAARPTQNLRIRICNRLEKHIVSSPAFAGAHRRDADEPQQTVQTAQSQILDSGGYGIAVDIGTTTLAACLYGWTSGIVYEQYTVMASNSGRVFGADVLSRMCAAEQGKRAQLQELLQSDVRLLLERLLSETGVEKKQICRIVLAANQTMVHLLMGYSCASLAAAPFDSKHKHLISADAQQIFRGAGYACPVEILPAVSAFVGGDVVAGMLSLGMDAGDETRLLLDIGTNGELALRHRGRIYVTSAAAGPAFEGGGLSCGCASVAGAICGVRIAADKKPQLSTIGGALPVGICGSGVLELVSELRRCEFLNATGLFTADVHREKGYMLAKAADGMSIVFTQKDVRSVQLAKAALRAGIELLLAEAGVAAEDVARIYLAGGFGVCMDEQAAIRIGLLPPQFSGRICAVGNSSLSGAVCAGQQTRGIARCERLLAQCQQLELARHASFQEVYVDRINFPDK